jgi:FAD/FMN-containing dehydrogenase
VAPLRALADPLADLVRPMPYPDIYQFTQGGPEVDQEVTRSLFVDSVDRSGAEAILEHLLASTAPLAVAQLRVLGGAMARVPAEATAFAHRSRRVMVAVGAVYQRPEETPTHQAWVASLTAALRRGDQGVYVNFLGDEGPQRIREAYPGSSWERLAAIKARYDPTNLFHHNQNIPPATKEPGQ